MEHLDCETPHDDGFYGFDAFFRRVGKKKGGSFGDVKRDVYSQYPPGATAQVAGGGRWTVVLGEGGLCWDFVFGIFSEGDVYEIYLHPQKLL